MCVDACRSSKMLTWSITYFSLEQPGAGHCPRFWTLELTVRICRNLNGFPVKSCSVCDARIRACGHTSRSWMLRVKASSVITRARLPGTLVKELRVSPERKDGCCYVEPQTGNTETGQLSCLVKWIWKIVNFLSCLKWTLRPGGREMLH